MMERDGDESARLMETFTIHDADADAHQDEEALLHNIDWKSAPRTLAAHGLHMLSRTAIRLLQLPARVRELGYADTLRVVFDYPSPALELRSTAWLDGLRGLAAFEVFIFHNIDGWIDRTLSYGTGKYSSPAWYYAPFIRTIYGSGDAAVCIFFAISGYVLTYKMLRIMRQQRYDDLLTTVSSAVFRRGIRLYMPVFIETLTLMLACRLLGLPTPGVYALEPTFWMELKSWFLSFGHLLLPLRYPDRWDALLNRYDGAISWTIPLEYHGSLYVYLSIVFLARVPSVVIRRILIFAMVAQNFCKDDWIAAQFLMGMAFADYQIERELSEPKVSRRPWLRPLVTWGFFLFGFYLAGLPGARGRNEYERDPRVFPRPYYDWLAQPIASLGLYLDRQTDRYFQCFAGMCLLIGIGEIASLKRGLETRFVQYLGRISFGLYLCHIFLRAWMAPLLGAKIWISAVGLDPSIEYSKRSSAENGRLFIAYVLTMIPATCVNFIVGGLFRRYLDQPAIDAGRNFERWCLSFGKKDGLPVLNGGATAPGPPLQMQEVDVADRAGRAVYE
ncbi:hypothetical protein B0A50_04666 [Lecanosticta acicola]|uniref:Acyltransferase 3 domain-containing protein n=1 Tax=Lecanosticta acicola TaxID=111012 RepID=A0AAI8Z8B0_9PEZI|nr:hypothetical protein B0A50_04666 [Lecanosticta acicola]